MTKVKFCGITRLCDINVVNQLLPEYIGFVFYSKSKRYLSTSKAKILKKNLNKKVKAVGVFVNENIQKVSDIADSDVIDIIQLHGNEDEIYINKLKLMTDKPIIKAFEIKSINDINEACQSKADYVLLDSGKGGTGTAFNWSLLYKINRPYFLAGGLYCDNIDKVLKDFNPYAVDVSSGIESNGLKDEYKMQQFINKVRSVQNERGVIIYDK